MISLVFSYYNLDKFKDGIKLVTKSEIIEILKDNETNRIEFEDEKVDNRGLETSEKKTWIDVIMYKKIDEEIEIDVLGNVSGIITIYKENTVEAKISYSTTKEKIVFDIYKNNKDNLYLEYYKELARKSKKDGWDIDINIK